MNTTLALRQFSRLFRLATVCAAVAACVTINVYFPAAAAEKAADQIIDAVTGGGASSGDGAARPRAPSPAVPPQTRIVPPAHEGLLAITIGRALYALVPAAHAQEANLDLSTPEIRTVVASMSNRFGQLQPHFDSGAIGMTANGLIEVRDANAAPLPDRPVIAKLVADDNRDREALYAAIARANGHPEWIADIRRTFARRWVERGAKAGWYYQNATGAWTQK